MLAQDGAVPGVLAQLSRWKARTVGGTSQPAPASAVRRWAVSLAWPIVEVLVWRPLAYLYLHGPWLGGYGFWAGLHESEICARLTGVAAAHWAAGSAAGECAQLVARHYWAFCTGVHAVFYFSALAVVAFKLMRAGHPSRVEEHHHHHYYGEARGPGKDPG